MHTHRNMLKLSDDVYPLVNIQKAIEHDPVEIVDLPIKNSAFPSFFVGLPGQVKTETFGNRNAPPVPVPNPGRRHVSG